MIGPQEQAIRRSFDSFFNPCAPSTESPIVISHTFIPPHIVNCIKQDKYTMGLHTYNRYFLFVIYYLSRINQLFVFRSYSRGHR